MKLLRCLGRYAMNFLISIDQLGNSILGGDPDETISSRLGRIKKKYGGSIPWSRPISRITEGLLNIIQTAHCNGAIEAHKGHGALLDGDPDDIHGAGTQTKPDGDKSP